MSDINPSILGPAEQTISNPTTISTPAEWAAAQLTYMGDPVTQSNIDFLVSWAAIEGGNWNNTATFNPLNTTLNYKGAPTMSGGNTAGVKAYASWADGIAATAATLNGYGQIEAALKSGNASAANSSGQLGADFSKWSGGGYTSIGSNTSYGNKVGSTGTYSPGTTGGTVGTGAAGTGTGGLPTPPGLNDIPGLDAYIRTNLGSDAWLLDVSPEVKSVVEKAVAQGYGNDEGYLQAQIQGTEWWRTTSQNLRSYEENKAQNPSEYDFNVKGSTAAQQLTDVQALAAKQGVQIDTATAQQLALNVLQYGWNTNQLQSALGTQVYYNGNVKAPGGGTNAGALITQLQSAASQYLLPMTPSVLQSWAQNLAAGTQTIDQFDAFLKQQSSLKWTGMAPQIQQGYTPNQIVDNLRSTAAQTMEVSPNSIDFVNNPTYAKILDYVPPGSTTGVHQIMTQSEMNQYLKSTPAWDQTQQARDQASTLESTITQAFGKVGG